MGQFYHDISYLLSLESWVQEGKDILVRPLLVTAVSSPLLVLYWPFCLSDLVRFPKISTSSKDWGLLALGLSAYGNAFRESGSIKLEAWGSWDSALLFRITKCPGTKRRPHPSFQTLQLSAQMLSRRSTEIAPILRINAYGKSWILHQNSFSRSGLIFLAQVATSAFHLTSTRTTQTMPRGRSNYPRSHSKFFQLHYLWLDNLPSQSWLYPATRSNRSL